MANTVNTVTEAMKILFEPATVALSDFINLFFPDRFTTAQREIPVDQIVDTRTLAGYRTANGTSNVLKYNPGSGTVYDPPAIAVKTPVSEDLASSVTVGFSPNDPVSAQLTVKYGRIQIQQARRIYQTMVKQAMDIFTTGGYQPIDGQGNNIGAPISFGRDAANNPAAADYSATVLSQLGAAWDLLDAKGCPSTGRFALVGSTVLARLEANTDFQKSLEMQGVNAGRVFLGTDNRVVQGIITMKMPKKAGMITLLAFNEYYVNAAGASVPYVPALGCVMGSFNSPRTQAYGGIFVTDTTNNNGAMYEGEIITDRFVEKDPDGLVLRTQSRPLLIPGIADHTAYVASSV